MLSFHLINWPFPVPPSRRPQTLDSTIDSPPAMATRIDHRICEYWDLWTFSFWLIDLFCPVTPPTRRPPTPNPPIEKVVPVTTARVDELVREYCVSPTPSFRLINLSCPAPLTRKPSILDAPIGHAPPVTRTRDDEPAREHDVSSKFSC